MTGECVLVPEWEEQDGVLFCLPHRREVWDNVKDFDQLLLDYLRFVVQVAGFEPVLLLVSSVEKASELFIRHDLSQNNVNMVEAMTNDSWIRDFGPIGVRGRSGIQLLDFSFNGWGGKFDFELDNSVTQNLADKGVFGKTQVVSEDLVLEGGSIDVNDRGELLTTASCLLGKTRNARLSRSEIEQRLMRYFGATCVHWLEHGGLVGDDTDGHVDLLARFVSSSQIVYCASDDVNYPLHAELKVMEDELSQLRGVDGRRYELLPLFLPKPQVSLVGELLPASYVNFLIVNGGVMVPTFSDVRDGEALSLLAGVFPGREVHGVDSRLFVHQGGGPHCLTMQLPRGAWS